MKKPPLNEDNVAKIFSDIQKKIELANKGKPKGMYGVIIIPKKYKKNPRKYIALISSSGGFTYADKTLI